MSSISRRGAERLKRQLERAEGSRYNDPPVTSGRPVQIGYALHIKTGGSGVGAATSVTQMTSGVVAVWNFGPTGAGVDSGETVTVWNKSTTSIAANKHGLAVMTGCGYVVDWVEC